MKTFLFHGSLHGCLIGWFVLLLGTIAPKAMAQSDEPVITSISPEGGKVIVTVSVPAGIQRVTLEGRARLGAGAWAPVAVTQHDGTAGIVTFRVSTSRESEVLRVRADRSQPLPAAFYRGTNVFEGIPGNAPGVGVPVYAFDTTDGATTGDISTRAVVESDIWKIDGNTLYFFNQYRGLQVIDITNPDQAKIRGSLELPASGEQMYLADSNHVVLLAANGCAYGTDGSQAMIVRVSDGVPVVVTNLPVAGYIQESRMVGTALYVASQTYRPAAQSTDTAWEWGTLVSAFDLADPEHPLSRDSLWYPGYGNVVTATDTFLFVATQDSSNWWQSVVRIIDITAPEGTMAEFGTITTAGQVKEKFNLNYADGVLTTISEDWHWNNGRVLVTKLETYSVPHPSSMGPRGVAKLGELSLGGGERLHATRFGSNVVYVVTFFQVDPLWVVDLSDPTKPHVAGSVEIPGWSTYIEPLGAQLVTVGVETNRVAVSLFDVADPAKPTLQSRVRLGENYSWSEANSDEKAFAVLPDAGLILVPYNGDTTNGWTSSVQLIDLLPTKLVARGVIQHPSQPRRATLSHDRILSLSGWELLSVDATDRDKPLVRGTTELAWAVDRVFVQGEYLLQLGASTVWWRPQSQPAVRVTPATEPNRVLSEITLPGPGIVGAALKDGRLYLARAEAGYYPILDGTSGDSNDSTNAPNFVLTVVELGNLPELAIVGETSARIGSSGWGGSWEPVWPKAGALVWAGGGSRYWAWPLIAGPVGLIYDRYSWWRPWGSAGGQLLGFDVANPAQPKFVSEVNLTTNQWWSFSQAFSSGTLVFLSHASSDPAPDPNPSGTWVQRSYLDVIDYADPLSPTLRTPVNIPGTLQGISGGGEMLFTTGVHWITNDNANWKEWLDASAYDGVSAHLVASLPLPEVWPHPVLAIETNLFIGRPGYNYSDTNVVAHQLERWILDQHGSFSALGRATLQQAANSLISRSGWVVAQETDNSVDLFDFSDPERLTLVGRGEVPGCLWFDLDQVTATANGGLLLPLGDYGLASIPNP